MGDGDGARWSESELSLDEDPSGTPKDTPAFAAERIVGDPFADLIEQPPADLELAIPVPPRASASTAESAVAPREVADADVAALADYGPSPANIVGTVPYAVLVVTRQRALRKALVDVSRLRASAARDVDESLIELGRALHEKNIASPELASQLAQVEEASRVTREKNEEWKRARDATDAQRESLATKIEEAERAAAPYRDRETKLATQMNVRETDLRRAKALLSRAQIELRNVKASKPDAAREELLSSDCAARSAESDREQAKVDELAPELAEARRELAAKVAAINELNEQKRAVETAHKSSEKMHVSSAGEAEKRYHEALRALASDALARGVAQSAEPDKAKSAQRIRAALATREREVLLHERALSVYDKRAFQKGAALIGGAAFLILAALIVLIIR